MLIFSDRVLVAFKNIMEINRNEILEDNFFPQFYINQLLSFHRELQADLEIINVNYMKIYSILKKYKVYLPDNDILKHISFPLKILTKSFIFYFSRTIFSSTVMWCCM